MSPAREVLRRLSALGARVECRGDRVVLRAGTRPVPAELITAARQIKIELAKVLSAPKMLNNGVSEYLRHGDAENPTISAVPIEGVQLSERERLRSSASGFAETGDSRSVPGDQAPKVLIEDVRLSVFDKPNDLCGFQPGPASKALNFGRPRFRGELRTPADPAELVLGLDPPRKNPAKVPKPEALIPEAAASYRGGVLPEELRTWSRDRRRAACFPQELVAKRIGLSRSQLANAEAGRFGLSPEAAARFISTVAALPLRQDQML